MVSATVDCIFASSCSGARCWIGYGTGTEAIIWGFLTELFSFRYLEGVLAALGRVLIDFLLLRVPALGETLWCFMSAIWAPGKQLSVCLSSYLLPLIGSNSLTRMFPTGVNTLVNLCGVGVVGPLEVIIRPFSCWLSYYFF